MAKVDAASHDEEAEKSHCPKSRIMQNFYSRKGLLVLTMFQERFPSINNGKTLIYNFNTMPRTGHPNGGSPGSGELGYCIDIP